MHRAFLYFAGITGMATVFLVTLILAALVLGSFGTATPAAAGSPGATATPAASADAGGTFTITAFDLGFEPAMVHLDRPGTYEVTFVNDGGTYHDVTFADGTVIGAEGHATATGEVTVPAEGISFLCSVPGHADGGMRGEVMVGIGIGLG